MILLAALIVIIAGIKTAVALVVPFLLALFIGILVSTPVNWLISKRVPQSIAIILAIATIFLLFFILGIALSVSIQDFIERLPKYEDSLQALLDNLVGWLQEKGINITSDFISTILDPVAAMQFAGNIFQRISNLLSNSLLIFLLVIFIIAEVTGLPRKLYAAWGDDKALQYFIKFHKTLNKYMLIKTLVSVLTGFTVWVMLVVLGVDFPLLWGLLAALLNFIPTIGSLIAAIPVLLLVMISDGLGLTVLTGIGYVLINMVYGNFLEPRLTGNQLGLSTLIVFMSLIFWGWVMGPVGMILSVPLTMTIKIALESNEKTRPWAILMSSDKEVLALTSKPV